MFTSKDLAERYSVTVKTIHKWTRSGVLPAPIVVGRCFRWREDDLDLWERYLAERAAEKRFGLDPDRPDGPAPPVFSTGLPMVDARQEKARRGEAQRRAGQSIRPAEHETVPPSDEVG